MVLIAAPPPIGGHASHPCAQLIGRSPDRFPTGKVEVVGAGGRHRPDGWLKGTATSREGEESSGAAPHPASGVDGPRGSPSRHGGCRGSTPNGERPRSFGGSSGPMQRTGEESSGVDSSANGKGERSRGAASRPVAFGLTLDSESVAPRGSGGSSGIELRSQRSPSAALSHRPGTYSGPKCSATNAAISAGVACPDGHSLSYLYRQLVRRVEFQGDAVRIAEVQVVPHLHVPDGGVGDAVLVEAALPGFELFPRGRDEAEVVQTGVELGEGSAARSLVPDQPNVNPVPGCMQMRP